MQGNGSSSTDKGATSLPPRMPEPVRPDGMNIVMRPMVGWYAACESCGRNLTEAGNDFTVCWAQLDYAIDNACDILSCDGVCGCGHLLVEDDDD